MSLKRWSTFWRVVIIIVITVVWGAFVLFIILPLFMKNGFVSKSPVLFNGFMTIIIGAAPTISLWYCRDKAKHIDQKHVERELKIKENSAEWDNLIKYQTMAKDSNLSDSIRTSAIYALGEFYEKELSSNYPYQTHMFFKKLLDDFWSSIDEYKEYKKSFRKFRTSIYRSKIIEASYQEIGNLLNKLNRVIMPEYIKAIHNVVKNKCQSKYKKGRNFFHEDNNLALNDFNFTKANFIIKATKFPFKGVNLSSATLNKADFTLANLGGCSFNASQLDGACFIMANLVQVNFIDTILSRSIFIFSNITGSSFNRSEMHFCIFYRNTISCTSFEESSMFETMFENANLKDCNFSTASIHGAYFNNATYDDKTNFPNGFVP